MALSHILAEIVKYILDIETVQKIIIIIISSCSSSKSSVVFMKYMYHVITLFLWEFFTSVNTDGLQLEFDWQQVSRILLTILADLNNPVALMVSTCVQIYESFCLLLGLWGLFRVLQLQLVSQSPSYSIVFLVL